MNNVKWGVPYLIGFSAVYYSFYINHYSFKSQAVCSGKNLKFWCEIRNRT